MNPTRFPADKSQVRAANTGSEPDGQTTHQSRADPGSTKGPAFDRAALETLYIRLEKPLYNVVYRWLWNQEDARDTVQEAFVRLWNMRDRVQPQTAEALVYRIALNQASNLRRKRKLRTWFGLERLQHHPHPGQSADDFLTDQAQRAAAQKAIEALPERLRRVLMLCTFGDLTYAEIAQILSIAPGTVASRRNAAVKKLQQQLGTWEQPTTL